MATRELETFCPARLLTATAADIMMPNPVSIRDNATVQELVVLLTERNISGAPVIDDAGRPVGVVTQTDLLVHDREKGEYSTPVPDVQDWIDLEANPRRLGKAGSQVILTDPTQVSDIMTPAVFSVTLDTPARKLVEGLLELKVHRIFVVDDDGLLVGVISPLDVLRFIA
jgi:CBS-domain-containing membrane protein